VVPPAIEIVLLTREDQRCDHEVFQFADIPFPIMAHQDLSGAERQASPK